MSIKDGKILKKIALDANDDIASYDKIDYHLKLIRSKINDSPSSCKKQAITFIRALENADEMLKTAKKACKEFLRAIELHGLRTDVIKSDELLRKTKNAESFRRSKRQNSRIVKK